MIDIKDIFKEHDVPNATASRGSDVLMMNQYKSLEYRMPNKGKFRKNETSNDEDVNDYIDKEVANACKKKSWNALDVCFKWKLIQEYINQLDNNDELLLEIVKKAFKQKKLETVEYDNKEYKIKKLNFFVSIKGTETSI